MEATTLRLPRSLRRSTHCNCSLDCMKGCTGACQPFRCLLAFPTRRFCGSVAEYRVVEATRLDSVAEVVRTRVRNFFEVSLHSTESSGSLVFILP